MDETPNNKHEQMSDEELVGVVGREPSLFGQIIDRYEAKLDRYIRRLGVRTPEDRQDVLQDIFIKVYKNIHSFDSALKFSSWIYRIAHNETISWYRKRSVRPEGHLVAESDELLVLVPAIAEEVEKKFDSEINADVLNTALQKLEAKYRDAIVLRYFEHKEYQEISDILKIPTGSVGTLIHRGKKQLYEIIEENKVSI